MDSIYLQIKGARKTIVAPSGRKCRCFGWS